MKKPLIVVVALILIGVIGWFVAGPSGLLKGSMFSSPSTNPTPAPTTATNSAPASVAQSTTNLPQIPQMTPDLISKISQMVKGISFNVTTGFDQNTFKLVAKIKSISIDQWILTNPTIPQVANPSYVLYGAINDGSHFTIQGDTPNEAAYAVKNAIILQRVFDFGEQPIKANGMGGNDGLVVIAFDSKGVPFARSNVISKFVPGSTFDVFSNSYFSVGANFNLLNSGLKKVKTTKLAFIGNQTAPANPTYVLFQAPYNKFNGPVHETYLNLSKDPNIFFPASSIIYGNDTASYDAFTKEGNTAVNYVIQNGTKSIFKENSDISLGKYGTYMFMVIGCGDTSCSFRSPIALKNVMPPIPSGDTSIKILKALPRKVTLTASNLFEGNPVFKVSLSAGSEYVNAVPVLFFTPGTITIDKDTFGIDTMFKDSSKLEETIYSTYTDYYKSAYNGSFLYRPKITTTDSYSVMAIMYDPSGLPLATSSIVSFPFKQPK